MARSPVPFPALFGGLLALIAANAEAANPNTVFTDTFTDATHIDRARSERWWVTGGAATQTGTWDPGDGSDGACAVNAVTDLSVASCAGRGRPDAPIYTMVSSVAAGATQLTVAGAMADLAVGDEILIHTSQRASGTITTQVGTWETRRITAIAINTLTLSAPLTNAYDGTTHRIQVVRVPNYTTVTVAPGATLTTSAWTGASGGLLALRANGAVTVASGGLISAASRGFRQGLPGHFNAGGGQLAGYVGEGPTVLWDTVHQPMAIDGSGGGGDGAGSYAAGGGGAGYGMNGGNSSLGGGPSPPQWAYGRTSATGGGVFGQADLVRMTMGPAGGSGGQDPPSSGGGQGGGGGGIVWIAADAIIINGTVDARGQAGLIGGNKGDNGGGGGGAGGAILVRARTATLGTNMVQASGGTGGGGWNGGTAGVRAALGGSASRRRQHRPARPTRRRARCRRWRTARPW